MAFPLLPSRFKGFLRELKRRKVYRVGAVYVAVAFAVGGGADYLFDLVALPDVATRVVAIVLILGLPVALVLAWAYELRPDEGPAAGEPVPPTVPGPSAEEHASDHGASIVVLPFDNISRIPPTPTSRTASRRRSRRVSVGSVTSGSPRAIPPRC
jgi:hypothetical protein